VLLFEAFGEKTSAELMLLLSREIPRSPARNLRAQRFKGKSLWP
jgi:hypothetical protein